MEANVKKPEVSRFDKIFSGDQTEEVKTEAVVKSPRKIKTVADKVKDPLKEKRTTLEMPEALHEKLKIMAHWELTGLKEIITLSLEKTVQQYEKEHGELKRVPKSQRKK